MHWLAAQAAQIRPLSHGSCSELPKAAQSAVVVQHTAWFLRFPSQAMNPNETTITTTHLSILSIARR
jgi:hypothetical protein